jgi:hypothetical protein
MSRLLFLRTAIVLLMALTLRGQDSDAQTLKGIQALRVVIESFGSDVEASGLRQSDIQTDVELKLRLAGIRVLTQEEWLKESGTPFLYVYAHVTLSKQNPGFVIYSIEVGLEQKVVLLRDPSMTTIAPTWQSGSMMGIVATSDPRHIRDKAKDIVDVFLNAYLSVNPKK